jgi:hypothetical protein
MIPLLAGSAWEDYNAMYCCTGIQCWFQLRCQAALSSYAL